MTCLIQTAANMENTGQQNFGLGRHIWDAPTEWAVPNRKVGDDAEPKSTRHSPLLSHLLPYYSFSRVMATAE